MASYRPLKPACQTPISSKKRFHKLSLRKRCTSADSQFGPERVLRENQYGTEQQQPETGILPHESLSSFYTDENFSTPPFVTKSRPKYESSNYSSTPNLSASFIANTPDGEDIIEDSNVRRIDQYVEDVGVGSTPHTQEYNMFNSLHQNDSYNHTVEHSLETNLEDEQHGLEIKLNSSNNGANTRHSVLDDFHEFTTPRNLYINKLSPKSASIMTNIYGDVWRKTPGLFKKRKSICKIQSMDNECDQVINKFDSLDLNDKSLSNEKKIGDADREWLDVDTLDTSSGFTLKPKMLSFDVDNDDEHQKLESKFNTNILELDTMTYSNSNISTDSLFSFKRVRKKNVVLSSSSSSSGDKSPELKDCKIPSDCDKEYEISDSEVICKGIRKSRRKSIFRVENNLDCSVILIETDTETSEPVGKNLKQTDRKIRKLFSKRNNVYDDVEFISENPPNQPTKQNKVFEIIDDNIEDVFVVKHKDNINVDILSDNIQRITLKESNIKPNSKEVKRVRKKPTERRKKKENIPEIKAHNDLLDNLQVYGFMASLSDTIPSWRCDKEAKYYKDKFKSKKVELTQKLYKMYNEQVFAEQLDVNLPISWSSTLNTTAGRAYNKIKKCKTGENVKSSSVELSIKVLDTPQRLRDTLAHELCHVAAWIIDGQLRDGHGAYWKKWVSKTLQVFPELGTIPVCHSLSIHYKYTFKCVRCGYGVNRHSKSIDVTRKACGYCGGRFECIHNKKTKDGLVVSTPVKRTSRELKGFALYVKENYGNVRGSNTPHKQAMQYLGKQYAKMKATQSESSDGQGKGN